VILSDRAIVDALAAGELTVDPPMRAGDIRGVGIRVHLGHTLLLPASVDGEIDLACPQDGHFAQHAMTEDGYLLDSHDYALACTRERIAMGRSLGCILDGRSSIARQGLFVHCSSAVIDNVHNEARAIVLELFNCSRRRLRLRPGLAIGMLSFVRLTDPIAQDAARQYADQQDALPPRPMR
jgi:dCTP deaminase